MKEKRTIESFEKLLLGAFPHSDVLDTLEKFLEWLIAAWSHTIKHKKPPTKQENETFHMLNKEWVLLMQDMLNSKYEWFDAFGQIYENNASKSRRDTKGQFFTPESIVNLQVQLIGSLKSEKKGTISDPACGSGRYSICHHALTEGGHYYCNEDIDYLCCLMTVMNMLIHGAVGEVIWHNALDPDSFFGAWAVNHQLNKTGVPHIEEMKYEDSVVHHVWENRAKEVKETRTANLGNIWKDKFNKLKKDSQTLIDFDFEFKKPE